jgi:23S rRNA (adenine2030-N6)-methyltransferase
MLSYRHSFHAGNFADLLKHSIYIHCLEYMTQKPKSLRIIDTHSGAGIYSLNSSEARKNSEHLNGIEKIWNVTELPEIFESCRKQIMQFNNKDHHIYPGSPALAMSFLRPIDQLFTHELHPADFRLLQNLLRSQKNAKVLHEDGMQSLLSLVPPPEKRALVLIDPSYEVKQEYQTVVSQLIKAYKRFSTGTYLLWYPVVSRSRIDEIEKTFKKSGIRNIQLFELAIAPDAQEAGMTASGIIAINPPWTLWKAMEEALPFAVDLLSEDLSNSQGSGFYRLEQLVEE